MVDAWWYCFGVLAREWFRKAVNYMTMTMLLLKLSRWTEGLGNPISWNNNQSQPVMSPTSPPLKQYLCTMYIHITSFKAIPLYITMYTWTIGASQSLQLSSDLLSVHFHNKVNTWTIIHLNICTWTLPGFLVPGAILYSLFCHFSTFSLGQF